MKTMRFVWIDDQKTKISQFRAVIEAGIGAQHAKIELLEIKQNALGTLADWCKQNADRPPQLLIIDHIFNSALPFGLKGSSVAHLLRNTFPRLPMVCVTAMFDRPQSFDQEDISEYTALFRYQHLEKHIEDLYGIARDFPKLHTEAKGVRLHFVECLKPPKRDRDELLRILPEEFQDEAHSTTEHRVARWILNELLARPGFLHDRLHTATALGLTVPGLSKVEHLFTRALYKGVFATKSEPRWWASATRHVLYELVGEDASDIPRYAGRALPGISEMDYSQCYVSKKKDPPPDVVVYSDSSSSASLRVVNRRYSELHPASVAVTPGFDAKLILRKSRS